MARSRFGNVRRLPSGRFRATFIGPDRVRQAAPETFRTAADARAWLDKVEQDIKRGWYVRTDLGQRTLREYCEAYLEENPRVGRRWAETCRRNMRLHLFSILDLPVIEVTPPVVRRWHTTALRGRGGRTSIAQAYRFLRAVLSVAVADEAIPRNPCRVPGAGSVRPRERQIATPEQVSQLVEAITKRYRAAVVLAAWCGLRRGEICALRRADVDLVNGTVQVRKTWAELLESGEKYEKDPKTDAGKRTVAVPPHVLPILREHAEKWAGPQFFCVGADGRRMNGNAIYQAFVRARQSIGLEISFHDLRHTGQSLAAAAGANLSDLKRRLGHSSSAAALLYIHSVDGRDSEIAKALSALADAGASPLPRI